MLKVAIDSFHYVGLKGGSGGTGTYLISLLEHLAHLTAVEVIASPDNAHLFSDVVSRNPRLNLHIGERGQHADALRGANADVLYAPFTSLPERESYASLPCVTAIHDLQHRHMPGFFGYQERFDRDAAYAEAARDADGILTFSEVEKERIFNAYAPIAPIGVVPHAPFLAESIELDGGSGRRRSPSERYGRYIIYPAVNWPHKNHYRLLEAFRFLSAMPGMEDLKLVLTGAPCVEPRDHVYRELMQFPSLRGRVVDLGYVTSRQLEALIRGSVALVFPSLYEGFGIPVVEAMRMGVPVIASNLRVFREWLGDSFKPLLDPLSPPAMARDIYAALSDHKELEAIGKLGQSISQAFTSERMAKETLDFLNKIASRPSVKTKSKSLNTGNPAWAEAKYSILIHVELTQEDVKSVAKATEILKAASKDDIKPGFHFLIAEHAKLSQTGRQKISDLLGKLGVISFYDPTFANHRALATRFQINTYEQAAFHSFISAADFTSLAANPTPLIGNWSRRQLRSGVSDAYFLGDGDWAATRKAIYDALHVRHQDMASLLRFNPQIKHSHFAVSSSYYRRLGGDIFTFAGLAAIVTSGKVIKPTRRFAYVEPQLIRYVGHHFGLTQTICHAAEAAGFECLVGANREWCSEFDGIEKPVKVFPTFSSYIDGSQPHVVPSAFAAELETFMADAKLNSSDVVYLHMPYPTLIVGILELVSSLPLEKLPTFSIRICTDDDAFGGHGIRQTNVIRAINQLSKSRRERFRFSVESAVLQSYFEKETGQVFPIVLNPCSTEIIRARLSAQERREKRKDTDPVVFGYFGEAREEKGFLLLPDLVESLVREHGSARVRFRIQVSTAPANDSERIKIARERLRELQTQFETDGTIALHSEFSSMGSYYEAMSACDVMLLPYDAAAYAVRGSGVVLEAMRIEAPVVVTHGTDMAETFAGPACITARATVRDFAEACRQLIKDRDELADRTARFVEESPYFVSDAKFIEIVAPQSSSDSAEKPVVIWIGNDVLSQGVSAVYKAQRAFFERQGYEIYNLYVPYPDGSGYLHSNESLERYLVTNALGWRENGFDFNVYSWLANQFPSDERTKLLARIDETSADTDLLTELNGYTAVPRAFERFLANRNISVVCCNYVHLLPVIDQIGLRHRESVKIILETHDIQSYQHALRANRKADPDEVEREIAAMKKADGIVAINRREQIEISEFDDRYHVDFILPTIVKSAEYDNWNPGAESLSIADYLVWLRRPDLQGAFNLKSPESLSMLRRWTLLYGHQSSDGVAVGAKAYLDSLPENAPQLPIPTDDSIGLPRYLAYVWANRNDIRDAFPMAADSQHPDRERLAKWWVDHGSVEHQVPLSGIIPTKPGLAHDQSMSVAIEAVALSRPDGFSQENFASRFTNWLERNGTIDLLIVGSDHPSNVRSIQWFLRDVYQPRLASLGLGLVVVGRICQVLRDDPFAAGVLMLGEVEKLDPLYRVAETVVAPVITGTGTPIKVLDALSFGCCATISRFVDPALGLSEIGYPLCSTAEEFAEDILLLHSSKEARQRRQALSRAFAEAHLTEAAYDRKWSSLLGIEPAQVPRVPILNRLFK